MEQQINDGEVAAMLAETRRGLLAEAEDRARLATLAASSEAIAVLNSPAPAELRRLGAQLGFRESAAGAVLSFLISCPSVLAAIEHAHGVGLEGAAKLVAGHLADVFDVDASVLTAPMLRG